MKKVKAIYRWAGVVNADCTCIINEHDWTKQEDKWWDECYSKYHGYLEGDGRVVIYLVAMEFDDGTVSVE